MTMIDLDLGILLEGQGQASSAVSHHHHQQQAMKEEEEDAWIGRPSNSSSGTG
jgi:hypothetical protein